MNAQLTPICNSPQRASVMGPKTKAKAKPKESSKKGAVVEEKPPRRPKLPVTGSNLGRAKRIRKQLKKLPAFQYLKGWINPRLTNERLFGLTEKFDQKRGFGKMIHPREFFAVGGPAEELIKEGQVTVKDPNTGEEVIDGRLLFIYWQWNIPTESRQQIQTLLGKRKG